MPSKSSRGKPTKREKTWGNGNSIQRSVVIPIMNNLPPKSVFLLSENCFIFKKVNNSLVITFLFWYATICSGPFFCAQQEFDCAIIYKELTAKVSSWTKSHVPNWFLEKVKKSSHRRVNSGQFYLGFIIRFKTEYRHIWMVQKLKFSRSTLPNSCVVKKQTSQTFNLFYLTLLLYVQIRFWYKKTYAKEIRSWFFSKNRLRQLKCCTHQMMLFLDLHSTSWKLTTFQYKSWHKFCLRRLPNWYSLWSQVIARESKAFERQRSRFCLWI